MKMIIMLLLFSIVQLQAGSFAQTVRIKKKNSSIVDVFREIKKQTGYTVLCKSEIISNSPNVSVDFNNVSLDRALNELLSPRGLNYIKEGNSIIVKAGENSGVERYAPLTNVGWIAEQSPVQGKITDQDGKVLAGVSVAVKGGKIATASDANGNYTR